MVKLENRVMKRCVGKFSFGFDF